jgi:hypothetical protein
MLVRKMGSVNGSFLAQQAGDVGEEHPYGILNTKFAKERKGRKVRSVIFASEFFLADFALKWIGTSAERVFLLASICVHKRFNRFVIRSASFGGK